MSKETVGGPVTFPCRRGSETIHVFQWSDVPSCFANEWTVYEKWRFSPLLHG